MRYSNASGPDTGNARAVPESRLSRFRASVQGGIGMTRREWRRVVAGWVIGGAGVVPCGAVAESGFFAEPAVTLAGVYDDNLFFSGTERIEDFFLRLSPEIKTGYQSTPLTLQGRYVFDAEGYARNPQLDTTPARQHAALDLQYRSTPRLTLSTNASYTETQRPSELNLTSRGISIESGRTRAERRAIAPALAYRIDPVTLGTATYSFAGDKLDGGVDADTHTTALRLDRAVSRDNTVHTGYTYNQFRFGNAESVEAHVLIFGVTHKLSPQTSTTFLAGPRFSEGSTDTELSASVRHRLRQGELSLAYARSQSTAIGLSGVVTTEALDATATYSPSTALEFRATPGIAKVERGGFQAEVYRFNVEMGYRLNRIFSLVSSYQYSVQRGNIVGPSTGDITRNVIMFGITAIYPSRRSSDSSLRPRGSVNTNEVNR